MKDSLVLLGGWLVFTVLAGATLTAPTPPGEVHLLYYAILASLPFASFLSARCTPKISPAICFGLLAGFILSWPLFADGRTHLSIMHGRTSPGEIGIKIGSFTLLISLLCAVSFCLGRRVFARSHREPAK